MLTIARLFGKSPFAPLQTHMNKVASCIDKLSKVFESFQKMEMEKIERLVKELSTLEHEADLTKNDIRNHLPKSIFLPIDRSHFLEILSIQDSIADKAEEIGILLTLRPLEPLDDLKNDLLAFYMRSTEVFWVTKQIIEEIDDLLESSFGGIEAEKVKKMVEQAAFKEYEAILMKRQAMKKLFSLDTKNIEVSSFYLWCKLIESIGVLAQLSEKLANRIRMLLEVK